MATHPGTMWGWGPPEAILEAEWRLCLGRVRGGRRQASVSGVFCYTPAFQRLSGAAECAALALQDRHPTQRGLLSRTDPFGEEKPLSRSRAAQQAVHAPLPTAAPVQRGPIQACLPGLAGTHDSMCCDISCRGQRLALGRINACFCLLSYFIYIFKTAYQGKKIALQKKKKKKSVWLGAGIEVGGWAGTGVLGHAVWASASLGTRPALLPFRVGDGAGEPGYFQKLPSWPLWVFLTECPSGQQK